MATQLVLTDSSTPSPLSFPSLFAGRTLRPCRIAAHCQQDWLPPYRRPWPRLLDPIWRIWRHPGDKRPWMARPYVLSYTMLIPDRFVHQSDALYYAGIPRTRHIAVSEAQGRTLMCEWRSNWAYGCVCVCAMYVLCVCAQQIFHLTKVKPETAGSAFLSRPLAMPEMAK